MGEVDAKRRVRVDVASHVDTRMSRTDAKKQVGLGEAVSLSVRWALLTLARRSDIRRPRVTVIHSLW